MNASKMNIALVVCVALMMLFTMISCGSGDNDEARNAAATASATIQDDVNENDASENDAGENTSSKDALSETVRPEGWSEETHGKSATPNYEVVFAGDKVHRIDVIIPAETWDKMLANMTELFGEPGTGGGPGGWPGEGGGMAPPGGGGGIVPPDGDDGIAPSDGDDGSQPAGGCDIPAGGCDGLLPAGGCNDTADADDGTADDGEASGGSQEGEGTVPGGGMPMPPDGWVPPEGWEPPGGGMPPGGGGFNLENPDWFPCTVSYNGYKWSHVGIRFKGNSSLMSSWRSGILKLPFRLTFDKFEDDYPEIDNQRFYGFKQLSFSSNWTDNSLLKEKLVADIFRDAGVPAPRTAFYEVYIDHGEGPVYFGLYTMVEIPDGPMLNSQFSGKGGNLYKPDGQGATFAVYDEASFDKETNEDEADFSDVIALYEALNADRTDVDQWKKNLEKVFDVDGFIKWLAVNTLIQNWDTYGRMSHNYYLYNDPGDGRLHWIPWDNNMALDSTSGMGGGSLSLYLTSAEVGESWPLIRYLMDDETYWKRYVSYVKETSENVFCPDRMKEIYAAAHELVRPSILDAEGQIIETYTLLNSAESFESSVDVLNTHVDSRHDAAVQLLSDNP